MTAPVACCSTPDLGGRNHAATFHWSEVIVCGPEPEPVRVLPLGVRRCVGAFLRPCVILTDAILCPTCWAVIEGMTPEAREATANGPRMTRAGWEQAPWWIASPPHREARYPSLRRRRG